MNGGELYVPEIPSYRITELVKAINDRANIEIVGIRPGEKLHEEMISIDEGRRAFRQKNCFIIAPDEKGITKGAERVPKGFTYTSNNNPKFLNESELKDEIAFILRDINS
jgi:FlaA1/EpsC-like NDP-sugar epimerase